MRPITHTNQIFTLFGGGHVQESPGDGPAFQVGGEDWLASFRACASFVGAFIVALTGVAAGLVLLLSWDASRSSAADGPECFATQTPSNLCQKAREIQSQMPALPFKIDADVTLVEVKASGPRLELTAVWHLTQAQINDALLSGGMTETLLSFKAKRMTANFLCGHSTLAAFVRLKGEIEYTYTSEQGHVLSSIVARECEDRR